ncbi:hypothetical protein M378DRAFT_47850, partial [Amanita muscaria Koide BX008]
KITRDFGNNSHQVVLPAAVDLKRRGIYNTIHGSLLESDRVDEQRKWEMNRIVIDAGSRESTTFDVHWKTGEESWMPYRRITHLQALTEYLETV